MQKTDVIVIGAGVAGLTASLFLAKSALKVKLIESKNFIGGRTFSIKDPNAFFDLDNGQHLFAGAYENYFEFLKQINSFKYIKFQKGIDITFIDLQKNKNVLNTGFIPGKLGILVGFLKYNALSFNQKFKILNLLFKINKNAQNLNYKSVKNFLEVFKQDEKIIQYFWEPLCLAVMNNDIENSDFEVFRNVLFKLFLSNSNFSKLAYSTVPLSKLYENFEDIFKKYQGELILSEKIIDVEFGDDYIISVLSKNNKYIADYFIFAVPPYVIYKLFKDKIAFKSEFAYSTIISAYIDYNFSYDLNELIGAIGTNIHWIFNRNKFYTGNSFNNNLSIAVTISAANKFNDFTNSEIKEIILNELSTLFDDLRFKSPIFFKLIKDKRATPMINFKSKELRFNKLPNLKNVFFAGDWTDTKLPATIEGACQSGINCMKEIVKYYKD